MSKIHECLFDNIRVSNMTPIETHIKKQMFSLKCKILSYEESEYIREHLEKVIPNDKNMNIIKIKNTSFPQNLLSRLENIPKKFTYQKKNYKVLDPPDYMYGVTTNKDVSLSKYKVKNEQNAIQIIVTLTDTKYLVYRKSTQMPKLVLDNACMSFTYGLSMNHIQASYQSSYLVFSIPVEEIK